jgi:hypothetical protein
MFNPKVLLIVLLAVMLSACSENSTEPDNSNFSVSFGIDNTLSKVSVDGLELSSVKILVRSLKLNAAGDDTVNVRTDPFVVELDLSGNVHAVARTDIPDQSYDKIKFEVHKPEFIEDTPDPEFIDEEENYSVVVKGTANGMEFTYKSRKSAHQIIHLEDPVSLDEGGVLNITLIVDPYKWFEKDGELLNPVLEININEIDNLIKDSFKRGFRDNNMDGLPD